MGARESRHQPEAQLVGGGTLVAGCKVSPSCQGGAGGEWTLPQWEEVPKRLGDNKSENWTLQQWEEVPKLIGDREQTTVGGGT